MLEEKQLVEGEIVGLRLNTGEEVITKLIKKSSGHYLVHKPLMLVSDGNGNVGFSPISMLADPEANMRMYKTSIMSDFVVDENFLASYKSAISPVDIPEEKKIIL